MKGHPPVLASSNPLSTLHRRFAFARLSQPCLPESRPGVSATLTTIAFDDSNLRWLEHLIADLEESLLHLSYSSALTQSALVTHDPTRTSAGTKLTCFPALISSRARPGTVTVPF